MFMVPCCVRFRRAAILALRTRFWKQALSISELSFGSHWLWKYSICLWDVWRFLQGDTSQKMLVTIGKYTRLLFWRYNLGIFCVVYLYTRIVRTTNCHFCFSHNINKVNFITEASCVLCEIRTDCLRKMFPIIFFNVFLTVHHSVDFNLSPT
jgi:hypothetical protein